MQALAASTEAAWEQIDPPSTSKSLPWQMSVSFDFKLKNSTPSNIESAKTTKKPIGINDFPKLADTQQKDLFDQYSNYVTDVFINEAKLPPEVTIKNYRGKVSLAVTINVWGEITNIEPIKKNRPKALEKAYIDALESIPFVKPPPLGLEQSKYSVITIERQFR